ncbi:hypothetical protein BN1723_020764, partial [Verticillium longisporum]
SQPI